MGRPLLVTLSVSDNSRATMYGIAQLLQMISGHSVAILIIIFNAISLSYSSRPRRSGL